MNGTIKFLKRVNLAAAARALEKIAEAPKTAFMDKADPAAIGGAPRPDPILDTTPTLPVSGGPPATAAEPPKEWTSEVQYITNQDLGRACLQAQERLDGTVTENHERISKLMGEIMGPGRKLFEMPQPDRSRFLVELAKLT